LAVKVVGGLFTLILDLAIGAIAGWLAGKLVQGRGLGVLKNIVLGILGAAVGSVLFGLAGFHQAGLIASFVSATVGAVVVLYCVQWFKTS